MRKPTVSIPENIQKEADAAAALVQRGYTEFLATFEKRQRDAREAVIKKYVDSFAPVKSEARVTSAKINELRSKATEARNAEIVTQPVAVTDLVAKKPHVKEAGFFNSIGLKQREVEKAHAARIELDKKRAVDAAAHVQEAQKAHLAFVEKHKTHRAEVKGLFGKTSEDARKARHAMAQLSDDMRTKVAAGMAPSFEPTM